MTEMAQNLEKGRKRVTRRGGSELKAKIIDRRGQYLRGKKTANEARGMARRRKKLRLIWKRADAMGARRVEAVSGVGQHGGGGRQVEVTIFSSAGRGASNFWD